MTEWEQMGTAACGNRLTVALEDYERPFWTGGASGALLINRCAPCDRLFHPPAPICPYCGNRGIRTTPISGRGTIYSFTVNWRAWLPNQTVPFVVALVALEEDAEVLLPTNIVGCEPGSLAIGQRVAVQFERSGDQFVPLFQPVSAA